MTRTGRRSAVRLVTRSVLLALAALLVLGAQARAATTGYLYTAIDDGVAWYDVGPDSGLTYGGMATGGPATPYGAGTVVMTKTADGENLYQLAESGSKQQTIYQYSASLSGALSAKSPAAVGSIPLLGCCERRMMAVVNPAAEGKEGQNAVYVLSGPDTEHAEIYIFDIDATTGALTAAGEVVVPGINFAQALAYSGDSLVIDGSSEYKPGAREEGFQLAKIDPTSGVPAFPDSSPNAPCPPSFCDDGAFAMLNEEQMLGFSLVPDPNSKHPPGSDVAGAAAYDVGAGWAERGSSASHRPGPTALTADGNEYFGTEAVELEPFELEDGEYEHSEWGDSWVEGFDADGLSEGYFALPEKGGIPQEIFALGSGLYISNSNYADSQFSTGDAYKLAAGKAPVQVTGGELGATMTGYLFSSPAEQKAAEEAQQAAKEKAEQEEAEKPAKEAKEKKEQEEKEVAEEEAEYEEKFKGTPEEKAKAEEKLKMEAEGESKTGGGPPTPPAEGPSPPPAPGSSPLAPATVVPSPPAVFPAPSTITPPPNTTIGKVKVGKEKVKVAFSGAGYGKLTFLCRLDKAKKEKPCSSPATFKLPPGKHTLHVRAVDAHGVSDPTPASISFKIKS
jgi:hypothetical protein